MKNFLIGMFGQFDENKFNRDFRDDFWGVEACMFTDKVQAKVLADKSQKDGFNFGVHFPLIGRNRKVRAPLFLSPDKDERDAAIKDFEDEAKYVSELGAEYILAHFPKPCIIDRKLDWKIWRFADEKERMYEDENPYEEVEKRCYEVFRNLSQISNKYKVKIILENDAYNRYFYETNLLHELFKKYPEIRLCLDFGRLHIQQKVDLDFNAVKVISDLATYIDLIHLWNIKVDGNLSGGHYPVLPEQCPNEGWGDIGSYLKVLTSKNKDVKVLFEHRSDLITDNELDSCYSWVNSYFKEP